MKLFRRCLPLLFVLAGLGLVAFGVFSGEPYRIMTKSITICLECIGVG